MTKPLALIIDDDPKIAELFAFALETADFETVKAFDGKTALEKLAALDPLLITLDMYLPDAFGGDILRQIRQDDRLKNAWVVVATGEGKSLDAQIEADADFVLVKPLDIEQLSRVVSRLQGRERKSN